MPRSISLFICFTLRSSFSYKVWKNDNIEKEGYICIAQSEIKDPSQKKDFLESNSHTFKT